jgi:hypothetical protein
MSLSFGPASACLALLWVLRSSSTWWSGWIVPGDVASPCPLTVCPPCQGVSCPSAVCPVPQLPTSLVWWTSGLALVVGSFCGFWCRGLFQHADRTEAPSEGAARRSGYAANASRSRPRGHFALEDVGGDPSRHRGGLKHLAVDVRTSDFW